MMILMTLTMMNNDYCDDDNYDNDANVDYEENADELNDPYYNAPYHSG